MKVFIPMIIGSILLLFGLVLLAVNYLLGVLLTLVGGGLVYFWFKKLPALKEAHPEAFTVDELKTHNRIAKEEVFHAVGMDYYKSSINQLAQANPEWKYTANQLSAIGKANKRIFRYNYIHKPVKLIPEPTNAADKNAVIVQIAGEKVAYISQNDNAHVLDILNHNEINFISAFIGGGPFKYINEEGRLERDENMITVTVKINYVTYD